MRPTSAPSRSSRPERTIAVVYLRRHHNGPSLRDVSLRLASRRLVASRLAIVAVSPTRQVPASVESLDRALGPSEPMTAPRIPVAMRFIIRPVAVSPPLLSLSFALEPPADAFAASTPASGTSAFGSSSPTPGSPFSSSVTRVSKYLCVTDVSPASLPRKSAKSDAHFSSAASVSRSRVISASAWMNSKNFFLTQSSSRL